MSHFKGVKTNNAKIDAKEKLRFFNNIKDLSVLDIFCGSGEMYNKSWKNAKHYEGIDIKKYNENDKRILHIGDAVAVIKNFKNINKFDVFDIDAYGSPYESLYAISNKIKIDNQKHFIITDGIEIDLRMGNLEQFFSLLAGISSKKINNIHYLHDYLIKKIIENLCIKLNCKYKDFAIAKGVKGSGMRYFKFTLFKNVVLP